MEKTAAERWVQYNQKRLARLERQLDETRIELDHALAVLKAEREGEVLELWQGADR